MANHFHKEGDAVFEVSKHRKECDFCLKVKKNYIPFTDYHGLSYKGNSSNP